MLEEGWMNRDRWQTLRIRASGGPPASAISNPGGGSVSTLPHCFKPGDDNRQGIHKRKRKWPRPQSQHEGETILSPHFYFRFKWKKIIVFVSKPTGYRPKIMFKPLTLHISLLNLRYLSPQSWASWVEGLLWAAVGKLLVTAISLLSSFPRLQEVALTIPWLRRCLLHNLQPLFVNLVEEAVERRTPSPLNVEQLGYFVDAADLSTLKMAALHALARSMEVNSNDPLPPTLLLPTVSNVLLQTDDRRGEKWLEAVAKVLASQLQGAFLLVDPFLLASFLHIALGGGGPEDHLRGGTGWRAGRARQQSSSLEYDLSTPSTRIRARLAWEALLEALAAQTKPVVVYLRRADALLCESWDVLETFEECFGPRTGVDSVLKQRQLPQVPVVIIGGVILEESGASLVASTTKYGRAAVQEDSPKFGATLDDTELSSMFPMDSAAVQSNILLALMAAALADDAGLVPSTARRRQRFPPDPRKVLPRMFPTCVKLSPPLPDTPMAILHDQTLMHDVEENIRRENYRTASTVAASSGLCLVPPQSSPIFLRGVEGGRTVGGRGSVLSKNDWEMVFAWAASLQVASLDGSKEKTTLNPVAISEKAIEYGMSMVARTKRSPRLTIQPENSYEKQLLPEVVSPEEMCTSFQAIGALEDAKESLYEAVQLPLRRPYLFGSQTLIQPPTGVLLFGPPGTGKTLLARAVAAESGASFLELSSSILGSKWYGDSTKLVRAAFSLAEKLSPCVIFIDEVDALLGKRSGGSQEHEASRELKNEFFLRWDGLRSRLRSAVGSGVQNQQVISSSGGGGMRSDRGVLVLGATNRPFDLDEAVLRRFSVCVSVGLPSSKDRMKILKVILNGQSLDSDVDVGAIAEKTEGFSGSDLKQLCVSAAMRPVRELISKDKRETFRAARWEAGTPLMAGSFADVDLELDVDLKREEGMQLPRKINADDFEGALKDVRATVDPDSSSIQELRAWNAKYGTVGNREPLSSLRMSYFT